MENWSLIGKISRNNLCKIGRIFGITAFFCQNAVHSLIFAFSANNSGMKHRLCVFYKEPGVSSFLQASLCIRLSGAEK